MSEREVQAVTSAEDATDANNKATDRRVSFAGPSDHHEEKEQPQDGYADDDDGGEADSVRRDDDNGAVHHSSLLTMSIHNDDELYGHKEYDRFCDCTSWNRRRIRFTLLGCLSSCLVCTARLLVDRGSLTYNIHSVVILLDMALIHTFTHTLWLSVSGELVTIGSVLLFHYTKQTVWELMETTLIAALCSFHMIFSRSEHWDREEALEGLVGLEIHTGQQPQHGRPYRRSATFDRNDLSDEERGANEENGRDQSNESASVIVADSKTDHLSTRTVNSGLLRDERRKSNKAAVFRVCCIKCSRHFFDHFLDGSAGVMYTSFVGLIIDEFIRWGIRGEKQEL